MKRPLFLPLLSSILGLTIADLFHRFVPEYLPYVFLVAGFPSLFTKNRAPFLIFLSLFFLSWGNLSLKPYILHSMSPTDVLQYASGSKFTIEGVIDSRFVSTEKGGRADLRTEKIYQGNRYASVQGRIVLYVGEGKPGYHTGDRIRFVARLDRPRNYGLPGEFDYVRYLAYRGVYCSAYIASDRDAILIRKNASDRVQWMFDALADRIGGFISSRSPGEEGFILRALLLGDTGNISSRTKNAYTGTGVNHILSISGFHVSILAFVVFHVLLYLCKSSQFLMLHVNVRRLILLFTIPVVFFYLFLSGAAPATVRSAVMIFAFIVAMLLEREVDPLNSLQLAALGILVFSPPVLFDLSFQLSFLALWGILVLTPLFISPFNKIEGTIAHKPLLFFMVSLAAVITTLVPVAYYFHRITFTGLITNFFIVPLMGYGAVIAGFSALPFVFLFPYLAGLFVKVAAYMISISNALIYRLAALPVFTFYQPGRFDLLIFFVFLTAVTFIENRKQKRMACSLLIGLFVAVKMIPVVISGNEEAIKITFFSVGQGESTLVSFPDGTRMLIDGGGSLREGGMDIGERLLAPALWKMGVDRLDYVVLSHAHPDHLKGLLYILENFTVGQFWESGLPADHEDYKALQRILAERNIPVRLIHSSTGPIRIGEARIEPVSPFHGEITPSGTRDFDANESSLVFRLVYGDFSILFTGDIGFDTEMSLVRHPERLSCTVLKVPHHGSRHSTSPAFLKATSPKIALVSAGYGNSFGLPAARTMTSLKELGIPTFRTDLDGTIQMVRKGKGFALSTFGDRLNQGHFH